MTPSQPSIVRDARSWTLGVPSLRWMLVALWTSLFVIHSLIYLALIPPWQAPDEPTSIELLLTIEARGRLVSLADQDLSIQQTIVESMERERYWDLGAYGRRPTDKAKIFDNIYYGSTQLHRPPLYQLLLLPVARMVSDWPIEQQLIALRAATIMLGAITVAIVALIAYELMSIHPALPLVLPALAAFHPQFAYSSATFNSDNLAATLSALLFFGLLRLFQRGITLKRLAALGLLVVLGFFTKRTFLFVVPVLGLGVIWQAWQIWRSQGAQARRRLLYAGLGLLGAGAIALLIPGVWSSFSALVERFVFNASRGNDRGTMLYSLTQAPRLIGPWLTKSLPFFSRSFWGSFGWHQVGIGAPVAAALMALTGATFGLALAWSITPRRSIAAWLRWYVWLGFLSVGISITIALLNAPPSLNMLPQGRYLFPVLVPILLLMGIGLCWWWPRRWLNYGVASVWLALICLDVYCIAGVVIPGFYR